MSIHLSSLLQLKNTDTFTVQNTGFDLYSLMVDRDSPLSPFNSLQTIISLLTLT